MARKPDELKESRILNRPGEDDLVFLKTNEIHLNNEIIRLKSEIKILTEINARLNKELHSYHQSLGIAPGEEYRSDLRQDDILKLPVHLSEFNFLLPLLASYDHKINLLEGALTKASEDMIELEAKSEKIVSDNSILRTQLEKKCQVILDIYRTGHGEENIGVMFNKLERDDMNERMRLLSEENNLLLNNLKELNTKYGSVVRTHEEKIDEFSDVMTRYSELSKRNKQLELDLEDTRKIKDILEVRYKNSADESIALDNEKEELLSKLNRCENEIKLQKNQLTGQKKLFTDFEEKKSMEAELLKKEVESLKLKEREYTNKLVFLERDLDQSKEENRKLRKDFENTRSDFDQMLKMLENYELKLQYSKKREEEVAKLSKESKEKVEEALLQRDRVLLKEAHYQKSIEQMNETQRQEIQSLKEQYERLLENTRSKTKGTMEQRDQEIKQLNDEVSKLTVSNEKLQKELKSVRADYNKLSNSLKDTSGTRETRFEEYERRIHELEQKMLHAEAGYNDRVRALTQEKTVLESSNRQLQNSLGEIRSSIETLRGQNSTLYSENNSLKAQLGAIQREKQNFFEDVSKVKRNYESQMELFADDYNAKLKEIDEQLQDSLRKERSTREKAMEMVKTHEKIEDKIKRELEHTIKYYDKMVNGLQSENKQLTIRIGDRR